MSQAKPTLIIAAHGSRADRRANAPHQQLADRLAESGKFSHVTPAFLDGKPLVTEVLEELSPEDSNQVLVIPAMTAEGYYSKTVFPKRLAENANFDQFNVKLMPAIGTHRSLANVVTQRVDFLLNKFDLCPDETTVVIVGHGTRRNPNSGTTTFELADAVKEQVDCDVEAAFIDQDPEIMAVREGLKKPNVIAIPFLMGMGPHATDDVPEAFELLGGPTAAFPRYADVYEGRFVCDQPLGLNPEIAELCLELVEAELKVDLHGELNSKSVVPAPSVLAGSPAEPKVALGNSSVEVQS